MKVQIIYSHPSNKSYTFEILNQLKSNLEKEGLEFEISDLYAMNFRTDMSEEEYEREGFANIEIPIPDDVKIEHQKIENADCLIFLYPVWWSDCPAKLKGWFDRVYSVGYAYGNAVSNPKDKMKIVKYGLAICTAGHPNEFLNNIGISRSMQNVMIDDRLGKRFQNKEMIILGGTIDRKKVEKEHSETIKNIVKQIKKYCA